MKVEGKETALKKQVAYDKIKEMILDNELAPGEALVERTLSSRLNISRTPIREALRKLSNDGLVEIQEGKGIYVAEVRFEDIVEIYELRESLEGLAARLCAQRRTEAAMGQLEELMEEYKEAYEKSEYGRFMHIDMMLHRRIAEASRNKRLVNMISSIYDQVTRMAVSVQQDRVIRDLALEEHEKLIAEIRDGKANEAEAIMKQHIASTRKYHIERYYLL